MTFGKLSWLGVCLVAAVLVAAPSFAASQADCSGTYAYGSIDNLSAGNGSISADGYYSTSTGTALFRYYVDGVLFQTETHNYPQYYWSFGDDYSGTCSHVFEVMICPTVCDGGGCAVCEQHCALYDRQFVAQPCAPTLTRTSCTSTGPTGVWSMSASASGGIPGYELQSSTNGGPWYGNGNFTSGPWSGGSRCSAPGWTVRWRVEDTAGQLSNVVSCTCGLSEEW